jgi:UDP-glucose 4-epimerase
MDKRVLLTGVAGFIGSHVAEAYLAQGYAVAGADNFVSGRKGNMAPFANHPRFTFHEGDIRDRGFVNDLMAEQKPHIINHHAAQMSVPNSVYDPHYDAQENVLALLNLLMACKENPIGHFIFASSGGALAAEPTGAALPKESDPPQLLSPYAITKYAGEKYIALYAALFGFDYTALRYGNVYGPRQIPAGESSVVAIFAENAALGKPSTLYAFDDMPEGCTRDYVHVSDVVSANLLATEKPANAVLHISSAREVPIAEIYGMLQAAKGKDLPLLRKGPRAGDIRRSVIDNALAKKIIGWEPKVGLREGLAAL